MHHVSLVRYGRWPLVVAVYVDACMDGFLIGISSVAGATVSRDGSCGTRKWTAYCFK